MGAPFAWETVGLGYVPDKSPCRVETSALNVEQTHTNSATAIEDVRTLLDKPTRRIGRPRFQFG